MLVSAIIPTFNREKTIRRAVDSVLNQTWQNIETIVVDDGSKDRTDEVLKEYGGKIRVIRQKNGGPSAARNTGIKAATGQIISFLDSDDSWMPQKIERQVSLLQRTESSGVVCCVCNAQMHFSAGAITSFHAAELDPGLEEGVWSNPTEILLGRFLLFNQVAAIRCEALTQAGLFREDLPFGLNDDYDLSLRLSLIGPWCFIAKPMVEWHEQGDNISRTHRQLEICIHTLRILQDIANSPRFRPLLPQTKIDQRMRSLRKAIWVLRLKSHAKFSMRLLGQGLHLCLRAWRPIQSRVAPAPRMVTRQA